MATSGTATFSRNRDQIIKGALRKVGAIEAGETPDSGTVDDAAEALNAMVKHWQGTGIHIWTMAEGTLFLQLDQTQYSLGSTGTDHATETVVQTTTTAAAVSGATTITVDSITGISSGDNIGVQVDDGTLHWTTVNGAPAGSTVTLTTGIDDDAASGSLVFVYTTKLVRPLKILSARLYDYTSGIDTPLDEEDRIGYREQPNKTSEGTPTTFFYDRRGGANSLGRLHVWPEPDSVENAIKFTFARPIQDFSAASDDPDLPQEWIDAIIYNLALRLTDEYDVPDSKYVRIEKMAERLLNEMQWHEQELVSVTFAPVR